MDEEARRRKTWPNFVLEFTEAHQEFRDTDATVDELGFHSTNEIVSQIVDQLRNEYTPLADTSTHPEVCIPITETPPPIQAAESIPDYTHNLTEPVANTIQQVDPAMAMLMTTMMANMESTRLRIEGEERQGGYRN